MIDLSDARVFRDSEVTPSMRAWASAILADSTRYPMGSVTTIAPGVVARVEVHTWIGATGEQRPDGIRGVTLWHLGPHEAAAAPHPVLAEGVDVSSYQRGANLRAVDAAGRSFAYIRSADGLAHEDAAFAEHWAAAYDAGLLRGAYHYLRASRSSSDQVARFAERIADVEAQHGRAELPPCLDCEELDGASPDACAAAIARAVESLAAGGRRPLLYTMPSFWDSLPAARLEHVPALADLWVAHWGVAAPRMPRGWTRAAIWQYAATAQVPGIVGRSDVDRACGTVAELAAWGAGGPLPGPSAVVDLTDPRALQGALNAAGASPSLVVDGVLGARTCSALEAFQRAHGLQPDGIAGPATRAALAKAIGA